MSTGIREELLQIAESGKIAQAYLLESTDQTALLLAARAFAEALGASAADAILTEQEKPNLISVSDVRSALVASVSIRPYDSPYKVYIVQHAELMNPQAQNALLKTLEEPPGYVVILLLAANAKVFLPTILSRCVKLSAPEDAAGSTEDSPEAEEARRLADAFFRESTGLTTERELYYTTELSKKKLYYTQILDRFLLWYRDILLAKTAGAADLSALSRETGTIRTLSEKMQYEGIRQCIELVHETRKRLDSNVNTEISLEMLILAQKKAMKRP